MLVEKVKAYLVTKGFTANEIFIHHANKPESSHILLTQTAQNRRTDDGLKKYFNDNIRVLINRVDETIEQVLSLKDDIINELVKLHATSEIVASELIAESEPIRLNGKTVQWVGVFRIVGEFT